MFGEQTQVLANLLWTRALKIIELREKAAAETGEGGSNAAENKLSDEGDHAGAESTKLYAKEDLNRYFGEIRTLEDI